MLNEKMIAALESKGFKRWTKETARGTLDRLYINSTLLGLELEYYKTGNISDAYLNGERISNSRGYSYKSAKTYVDVQTGMVHSDQDFFAEAAQSIVDQVSKEIA